MGIRQKFHSEMDSSPVHTPNDSSEISMSYETFSLCSSVGPFYFNCSRSKCTNIALLMQIVTKQYVAK